MANLYRTLDGEWRTEKAGDLDACQQCGMGTSPNEYHPHAACLMFEACHNSEDVRANIYAVIEFGEKLAARSAPDHEGEG